jgi:formylglycine-generating enzyme required for sulfatase activity
VRDQDPAGQPHALPAQVRVDFPDGTATLGLTEDNKEAVLALCIRVSENPNVECRTRWLSDTLGEFPHRNLDMPSLLVDRHEASNADWEACVRDGACPPVAWETCRWHSIYRFEFGRPVPDVFRQPDHPVVCIDRDEARAYCRWRGGALPTADEWEAVARGGDDRLMPWGRFWAPGVLNWGERDLMGYPIPGRLDGHVHSAPVDSCPDGATRHGVLHMLGNVAEWVEEEGLSQGEGSVRGGDHTDATDALRLTRRRTIPADQRRTTVGVRCVQRLP